MSTFLSAFDGHWRRPSTDYQHAVRSYRISVDTNVLLELYRFTPMAREELLMVLRHLRDRLWIPHQVAKEYYGRRVSAVKEHLTLYDSVPDTLEEHRRKVIQELNTFSKRCSISDSNREKLIKPIEQAFQQAKTEIGKHRDAFDLTLERVIDADPVLAALAEIFAERTGVEFNKEAASKHLREFERRVTERIPPGYKDAGKSENSHGDFFVWEQLLAESAKECEPLLFVTNDAKEDWVRKEAGLLVGARPELVAEFEVRCQSDFLIVQLGRFLQIAKEELGVSVSESTVAQAENSVEQPLVRSYSLELPKGAFVDLLDRLHARARMDTSKLSDLSENQKREMRREALKAGVVLDNIKYTAKTKGSRMSFRLDPEEMEIVESIRHRDQEDAHDIEFETHIPGARALQHEIKRLEVDVKRLQNDTEATAEAAYAQELLSDLRAQLQRYAPRNLSPSDI
ncbi:PIN domain-containing protein [Streptomyces sp. DG2A-72]|nr:PIN domain-containing protein [Streptomyces sp. DG2A-72]MDO0936374.1 PIN domain-containing protein [Streptomyces sp. DG2A-72]